MIKKEELTLVQEWDKTFAKSEKVDHSKVTFVNRYGITLAADMYVPKDTEGKLPATVWCSQGAVLRPLRSDNGGKRIPDYRIRPVLYRRERRTAKIHGIA